MLDLGKVTPGSTIRIPINTFDSNDPSASLSPSALVAADIEIYKDGSTTQRASDSGYVASVAFDTIVGVSVIQINLADNTTAGFFEAGSEYIVVVGPFTLDAATINAATARFVIGYEGAILDTTIATLASQTSFTLEEGSADASAYVGCQCLIHDVASAVQVAFGYISAYAVTTRTVTLIADPAIFTMAAGDSISIFLPALLPTVAARTLDVNAAGEAGLDLDNTSGTLAAAQIAADAIGASQLAADAVAEIADGVLDEALSGHQAQGTAGAAITMSAYEGHRGPGIYIDDGAANTGTTIGDDGTIENPVSTIAAATTLATAMGIQRFYLINDTVITLAATYESYEFIGIGLNNQVTLGSQDVDNTMFEDVTLTGTQGGTGLLFARQCTLNALLSLEIVAENCWLLGTNTLRAATNHMFTKCQSGVAGTATPELTFPGAGVTDVSFRHYSGGLQINSATALDTMSYEADGQLVIDATCTSLTIAVRGNCVITDNGTTTVLSDDAAVTRSDVAFATWEEILTGGTHNVATSAGRRLRQLQESAAVYGGFIWIDTVNGTAGTTDFENGTSDNPVDSIADANTLAASIGISRFQVAAGSSITFAAAQQNQEFEGLSWTLALGGQNIDGSTIMGAAVSGIATNTAGRQYFIDCLMGAVTLPGDSHVITSGIMGTHTLGEAGDFFFDRCHSAVAGTAAPVLDFGGALAASNVSIRNYSGGLEIENMGAGAGAYTMSLEGRGQLIINANCSATSTVAIRGLFTVTDNAAGAVTLSEDARYDVTQPVGSVTGNVDGSVGSVVAGVSVGVGGIDATAFAAGAIDAAALAQDAAQEIADEILNRDLAGGGSGDTRNVRNALRALRNRVAIVAGIATVYTENDVGVAWTAVISTAAGDPISEVNPAGP